MCAVVVLESPAAPAVLLFQDVSADSGIGFVLQNSATPEKHQIETMAGGVAVFDFDRDGRPDIYFTNGARQPQLDKPDAGWHNALYRNKDGWTFEDVTAKAGVAGSGFHFGAAAADFDNDGHVDLFVAGIPRSHLFRNRGDGSFEDLTERARVQNRQPWPVAAGWFDYNNDGNLDLFVVNYVRWNPAAEAFCGDPAGKYRTYCHPKYYEGLPNTLFKNNGDGTFSDVSSTTGILQHVGKGMGLAFGDYDGDNDLDVLVTNDTVPNFLFRNDGATFKQVALEAGVAFNDDGRALSSMGVDFRDIDNDGRDDIFVTALANETYPLYQNLGKGLFLDITYPSQLGVATLPLSGWGTGIYDFDNDGWKDIFAANGDVQDNTELFSSRKSRLSNTVSINGGDGRFHTIAVGGPALHRGAAFGDFDSDGRIDVVIARLNEKPILLRNAVRTDRHWIGFRPRGTKSNRDGIGARIRIKTASGEQWNHVTTSVGYASSSAPAVHFGLGADTDVAVAEIRWPSGAVQRLERLKADRYVEVEEPVPSQ